MKNIHRIILLLLLAPVLAQAANVVTPRTKRINLLKDCRQCLQVADPEAKKEIPSVRYLFEFEPAPEAPKPVIVNDKPAPVVEVVEVSNQEILDKISPKIMPTGVMFQRGKGVLILDKGQLADGSSIRVNYGGKPYIIKVTDVTTDSFTLRLDDASLVRKIDAGSGRGVKRD
ncbi:hypothetical protein [Cerasicoccus frondis]|uniref:hypothetical protein n=1 Tax=Cerasicoccus frondis TaxID=490090 RepID=UPI002852854D|nr:hypothetical protein [Cerasicoccus frondis]